MAKKLIVVSHYKSNESIVDTVNMITGFKEIVSINLQEEISANYLELSNDDDYLCLLDVYSEKAINYIQNLFQNFKNYKIITGLNLPMILEAIMSLNTNQSLEDMAFSVSKSSQNSIVNLKDEVS